MALSNTSKKVAVGLSGGVDSAVAAFLLKEQGYDVTCVYMDCWDAGESGCAANEDKAYAIQNAMHLGLEFKILDFKKEYKEKVIDYFYAEYSKGRTPNPDVMCNKEIKFGIFFDWAEKNGFDFVATGHYARIKKEGNNYILQKGLDATKDQSYFLYRLGQNQLSKTLFPVGEMLKKDVRKIAAEQKLPSHKRPESMGICFVGEVDVKDFLKQRIEEKEGNVVDIAGKVIGKHTGVWFYTIGQRHGFTLNGYFGMPMYVIGKHVDKNELVVGNHEQALGNTFKITELYWINTKPKDLNLGTRIRHLGEIIAGKIMPGENGETIVILEKSIFALAPGQSAVFYNGDDVLGGGVIN